MRHLISAGKMSSKVLGRLLGAIGAGRGCGPVEGDWCRLLCVCVEMPDEGGEALAAVSLVAVASGKGATIALLWPSLEDQRQRFLRWITSWCLHRWQGNVVNKSYRHFIVPET